MSINVQYYVNLLNNNCQYRNRDGFCKWEPCNVEDVLIYGQTRNHCYWWYKDYRLCDNCENTIEEIKGLKDMNSNKLTELLDIITELKKDIDKIKEHLSIY